MAGVFAKLNLKDEREILVLAVPQSFEAELEGLPDVAVLRDFGQAAKIRFFLAFVTRQVELDRISREAAAKAEGDALLWFAYPKGSSKRYACDFNRDTGWHVLGAAGFEPVRQVAIDEDWSAIRFRRVEFIKAFKRESKNAISEQGRKRSSDAGR